jgi:hypothetical protein
MSTTTRQGMGTASAQFLTIAGLKPRRLEALMRRGKTPDVGALVGREYRGMNLGTAPGLLGIRKFIKGFFLRDRQPYGYNIRARQNDPEQPWVAKLTGGERKRFGFYRVLPVDAESRDNAYLNALLLDYGQGGNGPFDITSRLRDYIVRVHPESDDLLLGKAYMAIGPLRLHIGYFLIEQQR